MYELNICHLYPDLLNLYGDRGNIISITKRCEWRDIKVNISDISMGDDFMPENYDLFFLGGGQDYEQEIIQDDLIKVKGPKIINAIESNKVFLCICGGYQLLGNYYKTWDGKKIELLGAINFWTLGNKERMTGNMIVQCDFLKTDNSDGNVVGYENHSGKTYLGQGVLPFGTVIHGQGNNGEDGFEGAVYKNVYCTYTHGSLLPKNPILTDYLISLALRQKYPDFKFLEKLDDTFESLAHDTVIAQIMKNK